MASEKDKQKQSKMRKELVEGLLELMETDGLKWSAGWNPSILLPQNPLTGTTYRGLNRLYLGYVAYRMGYKDPRWTTFAKASKERWHVKKGSKARWVEYWKPMCFLPDGDGKLRAVSRKELDSLGPDDRKKLRERYVLADMFGVFNYEDIEGPEAFAPDASHGAGWELADRLIASSECEVVEYAGDEASYNPLADLIHIPSRVSFDSPERFCAVLIHEMSHSTGHGTRMNRDLLQGRFGSAEYALEELRAEISAVFTAAALGLPLGLDARENHACYLQSWLKACREDEDAMVSAIRDAERISDRLLANFEKAAEHANLAA